MSSIVYIDKNRRNQLVRRWRNQIFNLRDKLLKIKKRARVLQNQDIDIYIDDLIKSLEKEFKVVFSNSSNDQIVKEFDLVYWDEDKVDKRLREISKILNKIEFDIQEHFVFQKKFEQKIEQINNMISKYHFLADFKNKIENLSHNQLNMLNKIEKEMQKKIDIYNQVKQQKTQLISDIKKLKKEINKYSFLENFNEKFSKLEEKINISDDLDIKNINKLTTQLDNLKQEIKNKQNNIFDDIETIIHHQIEVEINDIDELLDSFEFDSNLDESEKLQQYEEILEKLRLYSQKEALRIEKLNFNIENKLLETKIIYQKEKKRYLIAQKIKEIKNELKNDKELQEKFINEIEKIEKSQNEDELNNLIYEIDLYKSEKETIKQQINLLKDKLESLGYSFEEDIKLGKVGYINTDKKEYKIKYVFHKNGKIALFFTRQGKVFSDLEKEKTLDMANKWCSNFAHINKELLKEGVELDFNLEEPNMNNIIFEELEKEETYQENVKQRYIEE